MSGITIDVKGDQNVISALKFLRDDETSPFLRNALKQAAQFLQTFIQAAAPKLTGRLTRSIAVRLSKQRDVLSGQVTVKTEGGRDSPNNAFYWRFLEEGWHTLRGDLHKFPFIASVFDQRGAQAAQIVIDAFGAQVAQAQAKIDAGP